MTKYLTTIIIVLLSHSIYCFGETNEQTKSDLYLIFANSEWSWKKTPELEYINSGIISNLVEKYKNTNVDVVELSTEETKHVTNYYLYYCLRPWNGLEKVVKDRKIDLRNNLLFIEIYLPDEKDNGTMIVKVYQYEKENADEFELKALTGKEYSKISKSNSSELIVAITRYLEKIIYNINT